MPSKSLLDRGFKTRAEDIGIQYRVDMQISKFEPLDAFALAGHIGIPIFSVNDVFDKSSPFYATLSDPSRFNAFWMPNKDGDKIIIHNDNHSPYRQQSNLMHELAHVICEHKVPDESARLSMLLGLHYYNPKQEQEAKFLGGCLQLTKPALQWAIKRKNEQQISEYYGASIDMVKYRLNATGVRKQQYYSNLKK